MEKKIGIACDHAGYEMKEFLIGYLGAKGYDVYDFGTDSPEAVDYADFAHPLAEAIEKGEFERGIALCGSGEGMAITLNKHQRIRAGLVWRKEIAELVKKHNNANVIVLPARFITNDEAVEFIETYLTTEFEGGRHERRIAKIPVKGRMRPPGINLRYGTLRNGCDRKGKTTGVEKYPVERRGIFRDRRKSEKSRAAARHRGINGARLQKLSLSTANRGCAAKTCGSKSFFTRPCQAVTGPGIDSSSDSAGTRRPHACIRLTRGNRLIGLHDSERISPKAELHGTHHLAASRTELGRIAHEKGRIASQCCGTIDQLRLREAAGRTMRRAPCTTAVASAEPPPSPAP